MIDSARINAAAARIAGLVRHTPLTPVEPGRTWFKCEFMQHTGTFKARGMLNRVMAADDLDPAIGVVAASGGNAGLAVAYAAARAGVPATVYVPTITAPVKLARLRELGASVVQEGREYAEAYEAALKHAADTGAVYCHAYDQPDVVAGAGTLGLELRRELEFDTVVVAVGGGGLMAGVAAAVEGAARVVGVEPDTAPTLHAALAAGAPVDVPVSGVAADSLGARRLGGIAFEVARRTGVTSVLVPDGALTEARRDLWRHWRIAVEHGAAAAYAALLTGAYRPADGERVVVVLCGANTDPSDL